MKNINHLFYTIDSINRFSIIFISNINNPKDIIKIFKKGFLYHTIIIFNYFNHGIYFNNNKVKEFFKRLDIKLDFTSPAFNKFIDIIAIFNYLDKNTLRKNIVENKQNFYLKLFTDGLKYF